jgi:hypothetical protein
MEMRKKIASMRAFVRMKREKEGYDISERADNYLNNPETRARSDSESVDPPRPPVHPKNLRGV